MNDDWNCSAPHGVGRVMSRSKAFKELRLDDFKSSMEGIYSETISNETLDEAPMVISLWMRFWPTYRTPFGWKTSSSRCSISKLPNNDQRWMRPIFSLKSETTRTIPPALPFCIPFSALRRCMHRLYLSIFNSQFSIPYVVVWHTWTLFLSANYQPLAVAPDTKQGRNYVHLKFPKWHEPNVLI